MYQVHSLRKLKYAQHKTIHIMGHVGLPIMGFVAMSEIFYKQNTYGTMQDKNACMYFFVPSLVQIGSSALRENVVQSFPHVTQYWRPKNAYPRSMATAGALLIKDYVSNTAIDYLHERKK